MLPPRYFLTPIGRDLIRHQRRFPPFAVTLEKMREDFEERTGTTVKPIPGGYSMMDADGNGIDIQGFG